MEQHTINVTRWLNQEQSFVEVGTLFWNDTLERENPLIGFDYHPDYLAHHAPLLPVKNGNQSDQTQVSDVANNDLIPNFFKQYLPSEYSKLVFNSLDDNFLARDQFHQLMYITDFKGAFGAIQLDYSSKEQANRLPSIEDAAKLLDDLVDKNFSKLERGNLTALYHPSAVEPVVNFFQEIDGQHLHSTLKRCSDETELNRQMLLRHVMAGVGIDYAVPMKIELDGKWYLSQTTGEQIIGDRSYLFNTLPVSVLTADSKKLSNFEQLNFTHIAAALKETIDTDVSKELLARALVAHIFQQKDFTAHDIRVKEDINGEWTLSPQEILPSIKDEKVGYKTPFIDTISSYEQIRLTDSFINMIAVKWSMPIDAVNDVVQRCADGFAKYGDTAPKFGLNQQDIKHELALINNSLVLNHQGNEQEQNSGPDIGMDF